MRAFAAARSLAAITSVMLFACAPLRRPLPPEPPPPAPVAAPAPPQPEAPPPPVSPRPHRDRERRAKELLHAGELARALTQWKILQALDTDNAEYRRQIAATKALIRHRVAQRIAAAEEAFSAGDHERAQTEYLRALALDPTRTEPLQKLREIDRTRALGEQATRLSRTLRKKNGKQPGEGEGAAAAQPRVPGQQERDYLETGIALFREGQYEESVLEIEKYLQSFPDDPQARRYLTDALARLVRGSAPAPAPPNARPAGPQPPQAVAETKDARADDSAQLEEREPAAPPAPETKAMAQELYEKGLRASRTDIAQAIEYWQRTLTLDPDHVQARLQLEKARRMQRTLQQISEE